MPRRLAVAVLLLLPAVAAACLWDADTLAQERSRFPTVLELVTGKYLRHAPEFYAWRAADRRKKLAADPTNLALHDDLVVALDRLGRFDEALAAVEAANALRPNRYETESNWGTVLLHAGRLEDGLAHIDAAVRINPDAHFGREVYQQKLVRWALDARKAGRTLPASDVEVHEDGVWSNMQVRSSDWLSLPTAPAREPARSAALKGVLGMMRSGQHEHPLLLEALGRLLTQGHNDSTDDDAKRLAARAYLRAADVVADPIAKTTYRTLARAAIQGHQSPDGPDGYLSLEQVEADFRRELADADVWYAELRAKEVTWVNDPAADPEAEFARLYAADPEVVGDGSTVPGPATQWWRRTGADVAAVTCLLVAVVTTLGAIILAMRVLYRRSGRVRGERPV